MNVCHDDLPDDDDADEKYFGSSFKWVVMSRLETAVMDTNSRSRIFPRKKYVRLEEGMDVVYGWGAIAMSRFAKSPVSFFDHSGFLYYLSQLMYL